FRSEPGFGGMAHQVGEIAPNERLTSGEVHLQNAERRGFVEHPLPAFGAEFGAGARKFERVRAIRAAQRAAMSQLGQHGQRRLDCRHKSSTFLSTRSCSI